MSVQNILASNGKIEDQFLDGGDVYGFVNNPMTSDLNCAGFHINNAGRVNTTEIKADNLSLLPGSALTAIQLQDNIQGNNNYISGCFAPPFGTSAIICAGTDAFLIEEDTTLNPLFVVARTGLSLGGGGGATTVPVQAPTPAGTANDTQVATTNWVKLYGGAMAGGVSSVSAGANITVDNITVPASPIVSLSAPLTSLLMSAHKTLQHQ